MTYDERIDAIRKHLKVIAERAKTDEVQEAIEAVKEPLDVLEEACQEEFE